MDKLEEIESQISWLLEDIANEKYPDYKSWMEENLQDLMQFKEEIINESR